MKRCVCEIKDGYMNIPADDLQYDNDKDMFFVFNKGKIVGAFDVSCVLKIYLSEVKEK